MQDINKEEIHKDLLLKRLEQLSLKSIDTLRDIPELEEPTEEQKDFVLGKLHHWSRN
jgi:hypothetical protein